MPINHFRIRRRRWLSLAPAQIGLLCLLACCAAFSTYAWWRGQASKMTFEQAIETVRNEQDEQRRCSAAAALTFLCEEAAKALVEMEGAPGKCETYARLALRKIHEASGH